MPVTREALDSNAPSLNIKGGHYYGPRSITYIGYTVPSYVTLHQSLLTPNEVT
ncbi:hypothetical protein D3C75_768280 [compost metagenome]